MSNMLYLFPIYNNFSTETTLSVLPQATIIMKMRPLLLPSLLLSVVLVLPAAAAWAVPTFDLPGDSLRQPRPYQGQRCRDASSQAASDTAQDQTPFDRRYSPCRLEDADQDKEEPVNEGPERRMALLKKIENWDGQNHRPQADQSALQSPVPEPESYAMLLGGLGSLALLGLRRQRRP
jgi:hypothetical protein